MATTWVPSACSTMSRTGLRLPNRGPGEPRCLGGPRVRVATRDGNYGVESELSPPGRCDRDRMAELVAVLQSALLPPELPQIPGVDIAACYRPADLSVVGGDFYDIFRLGQVGALSWATYAGRGRSRHGCRGRSHGLRVAAAEHSQPADALRVLNQALPLAMVLATSLNVLHHGLRKTRRRATGYRVTVSCGGHPLPLVVRADGRIEDLGTAAPLLEVSRSSH